MLSMIKSLINSKKSFQEAANLILGEDDTLDDSVILREDDEVITLDQGKEELFDSKGDKEIEDDEEIVKKDDVDKASDNADMLDKPIDDGEPDEEQNDVSKPTDTSMLDEPMKNEELPTATPAKIDDSDLLSAEIDLANNTMTDILPTPPSDASSAIANDDILDQHVDSGFGGEEPKSDLTPKADSTDEPKSDLMDAPIEDKQENGNADVPVQAIPEGVDDLLMEAITIGDANDEKPADKPAEGETAAAEKPAEKPAEGENPTAGENPTGENPATGDTSEAPADEQPKPDNPVTAAVKDKVEEIKAEDNPEANGDNNNGDNGEDKPAENDMLDEPMDAEQTPTENPAPASTSQEVDKELYDKLSNMSKGIEDIKAKIVSNMDQK